MLAVADRKWCSGCQRDRHIDDFWKNKRMKDGLQNLCKMCAKEARERSYQGREQDRNACDRKSRSKRYREVVRKKMDEQDGLCGLCQEVLRNDPRYTQRDHDHATGQARALLCGTCNKGLGMFKDNIQTLYQAIKYLEYWNSVPEEQWERFKSRF